MNKRHLHHLWTKFRVIQPRYFLALAVICGVVCVAQLRANNQHMIILRNAVYTADKNSGDVNKALQQLQQYVVAHMNTDLTTPDGVYPPIQLKYTYDRLVAAENARVNAANSQVYTQAQHYCEQLDPVDFSGHNRVPCIEQYVGAHGVKATPIPDGLYKFDFVSPSWSPDLAGWSMVVTIVSFILFVISLLTARWFKHHVA